MIFYAGDEDFEADGDCDHYIKSCPMVQTTKVGNLHNVMTWTIVMMMMVMMRMGDIIILRTMTKMTKILLKVRQSTKISIM